MNFCSHCGGSISLEVPAGDNRMRHVCSQCGLIHYQNPKIVAGTLPIHEGKILLCRRAIEPRRGLWTLPAGFMENQETTSEAAIRETLEEANAQVALDGLYTMINLPQIDQVHIFFRARLINDHFSRGEETLEVALFEEQHIPWDEIAFLTVKATLRYFFQDTPSNQYPVRVEDIVHKQKMA